MGRNKRVVKTSSLNTDRQTTANKLGAGGPPNGNNIGGLEGTSVEGNYDTCMTVGFRAVTKRVHTKGSDNKVSITRGNRATQK